MTRLERRLLQALLDPSALLIMAVLGICVLVGFVNGSGHRPSRKAKVSAAQSQIENFKAAVQQYARDNGAPPTTAQGLDALIHHPKKGPKPKHWKKYLADLNTIPTDPWGEDYLYLSPGLRGTPFQIITWGEDAWPGGSGYDADIESTRTDAGNW